ncbi:DUF1986 domain-containing protein [Gelidibacter gilvus]|uniref:DUF1986 domain-containing protein n=1 Tax=Gelidibacter gilvus TaxID=59602 RepID=A0A4Q0XIK3_9FLAO|nr:DUF1986 domain-containing protein [Gelidibacter gilvus]RXJ51300.1 DUF1986 domain-containing protein [Gelidibacter gilvus]
MKQKLLFAATFLFVLSVFSQQGIIGGNNTTIAENPWQISIRGTNNHHDIRHRNIHICGGSIIAPNWILTAAHCVTNPFTGTVINANEISIAAGITQRTDNINGQYRNVVEIIRYPNYNHSTLQNDVALLRLDANLNLNTDVLPILLTDSSSHASVGTIGRVTGWGNTVDGPVYNPSFLLQTLDLPIISKTQANNLNTGNISVTNNMIPLYESGGGVAPGDSGGPLSVMKNGTRYLIGCSSWGEFPKDDKPTIYTDLFDYRSWISGIVPLPSLIGNNTVCRTSNTIFTLNNVNATSVVWDKSINLETISNNNTQFIVRAKLNASGNGYITATFNGITLRKDFWVGKPVSSISGPQHLPNGGYATYSAYSNNLENVSYQWTITPSVPFTANGPNMDVIFPYGNADYAIKLTSTNNCGSSVTYHYVATGAYEPDRVYPNPSSDIVHINLQETVDKTIASQFKATDLVLGELYDYAGNMVTRVNIVNGRGSFSVKHLSKGAYILKININGRAESHRIIVK